ncbi:MAG: UDP-3-O-acyl-N-acetylglucosamine deacetylase [Pseudomonadota bacterium]
MASKHLSPGKYIRQRTLKNSIHCAGVGLHSGQKVNMVLHPQEADSGIVFRRNDLTGGPVDIEASWQNAVETPLCTTLRGQDGEQVSTIEHLMSALAGCGIDNVLVELNGPEVPIMDGSAAPFVFLIECAGVVEQKEPRRALRILKSVECAELQRSASLEPGEGFSVHFEIDFDNPVVGQQDLEVQLVNGTFKHDIARARTFGFLHEIDKLREMGLAQGGSLDNAVVISGDQIMNEGGLRYDNELVRHKILDSIGDLYLAGGPILGRFSGHRAGHALTLRLLKSLFEDETAWEWCDLTKLDQVQPSGSSISPDRAVAAPV